MRGGYVVIIGVALVLLAFCKPNEGYAFAALAFGLIAIICGALSTGKEAGRNDR